jgi:hypothetical protein
MAHELTDWYEEAERLRVERDALTARLVERDAEIAALREACTVAMGYIVRSDWTGTDARKALFALEVGYNPAPPTAAPLAAAIEKLYKPVRLWVDVIEKPAREVREQWGCSTFADCNDLITKLCYEALTDDALRAARGEASDA